MMAEFLMFLELPGTVATAKTANFLGVIATAYPPVRAGMKNFQALKFEVKGDSEAERKSGAAAQMRAVATDFFKSAAADFRRSDFWIMFWGIIGLAIGALHDGLIATLRYALS